MSVQFSPETEWALDYSQEQLRRHRRALDFIAFCERMGIGLAHVHQDRVRLKRISKDELFDLIDAFVREEPKPDRKAMSRRQRELNKGVRWN